MRKYMQETMGENQDVYLARKLDQMKNLGVSGNRYSGKLTLEAESELEVQDVFLGLKRGKLRQISADEIRWDIRLPVPGLGGPGEISFSPKPTPGEIIVRSFGSGQKVRLHVDIYVAPAMGPSPKHRKIRMSNPLFEIMFEWLEKGVVEMSFTPATASGDNVVLSLEEHIKLNRVQALLANGNGIVQFFHDRKLIINSTEFASDATGEEAKSIASCTEILDKLKVLLLAAGGMEFKFSLTDIVNRYQAINFICDLIEHPQDVRMNPAVISVQKDFPDIPDTEALVVGKMDFASGAIAYGATADVTISRSEGSMIFDTGSLQVRQIELIGVEGDAFDDFTKQMQDETGLRLVIKPGSVTANSPPLAS